jgi:hypothetical protein
MGKATLLTRLFLILVSIIGATYGRAEDRSKIDPNKEQILVTIGGINFDIPLGYFYEKIIWTKGQWPIPNKQRTEKKDSLVLVAHMEGMKPWSPQLDADFARGNARTTRITISGDHHPKWLDNFMAYRASSLSESKTAQKLPGLTAHVSSYAPSEVLYLAEMPPRKPYFRIDCSTEPLTVMCKVAFDYRQKVYVQYLIPVTALKNWQAVHAEVVALLDSVASN